MNKKFRWSSEETNLVFDALCAFAKQHKRLPSLAEFNANKDFQNGIALERRKVEVSPSMFYDLTSRVRIKRGLRTSRGKTMEIVTPPHLPSATLTGDSEILVVTQDIMVEIAHLLDQKLSPLMALMKDSEKTKASPAAVTQLSPALPVTITPPVQVLTEERVRAIFHEEIERIFGPIVLTPTPQPTPVVKKPHVEPVAKVVVKPVAKEKPIVLVAPTIQPVTTPPTPPVKKVFAYGLTREQFDS